MVRAQEASRFVQALFDTASNHAARDLSGLSSTRNVFPRAGRCELIGAARRPRHRIWHRLQPCFICFIRPFLKFGDGLRGYSEYAGHPRRRKCRYRACRFPGYFQNPQKASPKSQSGCGCLLKHAARRAAAPFQLNQTKTYDHKDLLGHALVLEAPDERDPDSTQ